MDRDMVNCIHRLYHGLKFKEAEQNDLFWCGGDTTQPLANSEIIVKDPHSGEFGLPPPLMDLVKRIDAQLENMPRSEFAFGFSINTPLNLPGAVRHTFLAIPYGPAWFAPVREAIDTAARSGGFLLEVTGDLSTPGSIIDQVWKGIRGADAVIADMTGLNPNVFYEIGLAHALGKEIVFLTQDFTNPDQVPFDVRGQRVIPYDENNLPALEADLESALSSIKPRYPHQDPKHSSYVAPAVSR